MNFGKRGGWRFFQKYMAASGQRALRQGVPPDRWRAQGHRLDLRLCGEGFFQ